MPKFNKKVEKVDIPVVSCLGTLSLGGRNGVNVKTSKSGYSHTALVGRPDPRTAGLPITSRIMIREEWLEEDFDSGIYSLNPVDVAKAKAIAKSTKDEDLPEEVAALIKLNSEAFVFQRNVYSDSRPSLLQSLLGDAFEAFQESVDGMSADEFFETLATTMKSVNENTVFIYEGQEGQMNGKPTGRLELSAIYRIESKEDLEKYTNSLANRTVELLWDPSAIGG